jgi:hypothetical protein
MSNSPDTLYLAGHIAEALARDERTHMLDVRVHISGNSVFLVGLAACASRRAAAELVARELIPEDMLIVNDLCVETYSAPSESEPISHPQQRPR